MDRILDRIDRPQDLHDLTDDELVQVAQEVREHIIDTVGEIGGHFGANLGTCELAVALHSLLDSPTDKVLWDVGHQAYPHKVLTGRRDQLPTIRQYEGLAPFCSIHESEHDIMGAGHASTSIGYAVGLKEGMRLRGEPDAGKVVAVIGDGAMTGGVAFEAIHQAGGPRTPIVVVLNDNGMSISPNVGALSRYFNRVRLNPQLLARPGGRRAGADRAARRHRRTPSSSSGPQLKESIKAFWAPGLFWEELDWAYVGVVDGHDVHALRARAAPGARGRPAGRRPHRDGQGQGLRAGRGRRPGGDGGLARGQAEVDRQRRPRRRARRRPPAPPVAPPQYTKVFGEAMVEEVRRDRRVVGITAAMNSGTGLNLLQKAEPEHYFDVGIAEQQAVLFAAGLALEGLKPVCAIYSTFLQRAFDQIVHDVCLQELDVVFAHGPRRPRRRRRPDAPRRLRHRLPAPPAEHHADGPARRGHARSGCCAPRSTHDGPVGPALPARRGARRAAAGPKRSRRWRRHAARSCARASRSRSSATAPGVAQALEAADLLAERGLSVTVADARFAKPLDAELLAQLAGEHELLVTVEEGVLHGRLRLGGVGGAERAGGRSARCRASCASACPTATSRTASRRCCTPRSASPGKAVAQRIEAAVGGRSLAEA